MLIAMSVLETMDFLLFAPALAGKQRCRHWGNTAHDPRRVQQGIHPPEVRKHSSHIVQFVPAVCDPGPPVPSSHSRVEQAILPIESCRHDSGPPPFVYFAHSSELARVHDMADVVDKLSCFKSLGGGTSNLVRESF
jgi:hypothetical protein